MNRLLLLAVLGLATGAKNNAATPSAESLLKDADRSRGSAVVQEGLSWQVDLTTKEDGKESQVSYQIKLKGPNALAEATSPARNQGETLLFNDRNLWFFKPGLKKPLAISPRQKLMGQAANGDIASTNYARDYEGEVVATEEVNGKKAFKLELKAKAKNVTYDRIRYWITVKEHFGIKAEFLTVSGITFKHATFEYKNHFSSENKEYPFVSQMIITDAKNAENSTTFVYAPPKAEPHQDSIFNVNNLVR